MSGRPIILYDGVCGLCNRLNQFLLPRDHADRLRFASLQSKFAHDLLQEHGRESWDLNTVYVVLNHGESGEQLLSRSDAILYALIQLGGVWKIAALARLLPKFLRDQLYNLIARNRYRLFGKSDSCIVPDPRYDWKFIKDSA